MSLIKIAHQISTVPGYLKHLEDQVRNCDPKLLNGLLPDELNVLKRLAQGELSLIKLCTEVDAPPIEENWWIA